MCEALKLVQGAYAEEVIKDSPDPVKLARLKEGVQLLGTQQGTRPGQCLGAVTTTDWLTCESRLAACSASQAVGC